MSLTATCDHTTAHASPAEHWARTHTPQIDDERVLIVSDFPSLGRLTALRFLEWVQQNPEGVISLPTGRTPEHFIAWVDRLLGTWDEARTRALCEAAGLQLTRPSLRGLHFVQIDEFYPMPSEQANSFCSYVRRYYLEGFGLDPARALLIDGSEVGYAPGETQDCLWPEGRVDLSLRHRAPLSPLEERQQAAIFRIDDWCRGYEDRIAALGGIGFFLGGIGPDGHIGFNVAGAPHHSTTRLTETNYQTQAAAASDLGGMDVARRRLVITIGLATITARPDATAIIMAAGEAKAPIIARAVESAPTVRVPATALHKLPGLRFYLTAGAASRLRAVQRHRLRGSEPLSDEDVERIIVDLSVRTGKRLQALSMVDAAQDEAATALLQRGVSIEEWAQRVHERLVARLEAGARVSTNTRFLHTEPHHDDVMLGYLPAVVRAIRDATNTHRFVTLTSGFTAVTHAYLQHRLETLRRWRESVSFARLDAEGYFDPDNALARNRDVWQFLDGVAAEDPERMARGEARRLARDLLAIGGGRRLADTAGLLERVTQHLARAYPGQKDPPHVQALKGRCREWEVECLWGYFGWETGAIDHLRLGFYQGDLFTPEPTQERDVAHVRALLSAYQPDVVTVALDPEASGPDTHYKVLQAVSAALGQHESDRPVPQRVWGYRNVWHRFHPAEANLYVPVSLNMFAVMRSAFMTTFGSQREASFPSPDHDGPFCELAQRIQVEQYAILKTCLGREWFQEHPSPLVRATRGVVFLKEMDVPSLLTHCRRLSQAVQGAPQR